MIRNILAVSIALGIFVATSDAYASRARQLVLGTGDAGQLVSDGSLFYDQSYNIFYNPSYVNDFKNWGIIEKSNFPGSSAQGGVVTSMSNFNLALYFNRAAALGTPYAANPSSNGAGSGTSFGFINANQMRPMEVMLGSDVGMMKWGAGLEYANAKTATGVDSALTIKAGVQIEGFEPFINFRAFGDEQSQNRKNTGFAFGTRYKWGEWSPFLVYRNDSIKSKTNENLKYKASSWGLGLGRDTKMGENARMVYSVAFVKNNTDTRNIVPLNVGVEGDATSWLTLRAGLGFNLYDRTAGISTADNASGRIGAAVKVGKAEFNWAVGKAALVGGAQASTESVAAVNAQTFDLGSSFFSAASLSYHW